MTIWAWFLTTKLGRGLLAIGVFIGAVLAALDIGLLKGKHEQATKDAAKNAQAGADAAKTAQATYADANAAAQQVQQQAQQQPPPDAVKRNDLDNTF